MTVSQTIAGFYLNHKPLVTILIAGGGLVVLGTALKKQHSLLLLGISENRFDFEVIKNIWQRLRCRFNIDAASNNLVEIENIQKSSNGQIEANKYSSSISNFLRQQIDKYPQRLEDSRIFFSKNSLTYKYGLKSSSQFHSASLFLLPSSFILIINYQEETLIFSSKTTDSFPENTDFLIFQSHEPKSLEINPSQQYQLSYHKILRNIADYEEVNKKDEKNFKINSSSEHIWNIRGNSLSKFKNYEGAIFCYNKALEINPLSEYALYNCGNAFRNLNQYQEAIVFYDKALKVNPLFEYAWNGKGNVMRNLKRYEEAMTCYENALEINPKYEYTWYNRGSLLSDLREYEEAVISYDKGLEINPLDEYAWYNRGIALSQLKRYEEAIVSYDKGLKINPLDEYAWYKRGSAMADLNYYEEAIASYDKALEINPSYEYGWFSRGLALLELRHYEEAIISYDKGLEINSSDEYAWYFRGNALSALKCYAEAINCYKKSLGINPAFANSWYKKACSYALQGNIDFALENLEKAISLNFEYHEQALKDPDFNKIRYYQRFQTLIGEG